MIGRRSPANCQEDSEPLDVLNARKGSHAKQELSINFMLDPNTAADHVASLLRADMLGGDLGEKGLR
jgi:hypothetical protein